MKPGTLAVISVAALGVVGYAAFTLMVDPGRTKAAQSKRSAADDRAPDSSRGNDQAKGGIKRVEPTRKGDARARPKAGPPPKPVPKVSLDKAREDLKSLIAEYDQLIEDKAVLNDERWVKLYARGADAMTPLQQHLSWQVPEQADELRAAQEAYRVRIDKLQRQVVRPSAQ